MRNHERNGRKAIGDMMMKKTNSLQAEYWLNYTLSDKARDEVAIRTGHGTPVSQYITGSLSELPQQSREKVVSAGKILGKPQRYVVTLGQFDYQPELSELIALL